MLVDAGGKGALSGLAQIVTLNTLTMGVHLWCITYMNTDPIKKGIEEKNMAGEKNDVAYPVKSLHDFLYELDREWSKFRNGTLISLVSSSILFVVVVWLILRTRFYDLGLIGFVLLMFAGIFLGYSLYALYSQYRFFNRWERRIGLLLHMEDELLTKKLNEK